jgi:hypothetical protein
MRCTREADDVDKDASDVCGIRSKVYAERIVVPSVAARAVQIRNTVMPLSNQEVFCDHDACNRAQEDGISGEVGRKAIAALEQVPGEYT